MQHTVAPDLAMLRRNSYPLIGEQLDALWKAVAALQAGQPIPADAQAVMDRIAQVKQEIPAPKTL